MAQGKLDFIDVLLSDMSPKEILLKKGYEDGFRKQFGDGWYITPMDEWAFVEEACADKLEKQFGAMALKGFGIEKMALAKTAAGAVLFYLEQNRISNLASFDAVTIKGQSGTFHITDRYWEMVTVDGHEYSGIRSFNELWDSENFVRLEKDYANYIILYHEDEFLSKEVSHNLDELFVYYL